MEDSLEKINDEEVSLPKATIEKIINESLHGKPVTKDLKEVVLQSAIEFIHLITSEANELCEKEHKKTITHDHIYKSLENLGYTHYIKPCEEVYIEHVNLTKMKPSKTNKFKDSGKTMEELLEEQTKLIAKAKDEVEKLAKMSEAEKQEMNNVQETNNILENTNVKTTSIVQETNNIVSGEQETNNIPENTYVKTTSIVQETNNLGTEEINNTQNITNVKSNANVQKTTVLIKNAEEVQSEQEMSTVIELDDNEQNENDSNNK